MRETECRPYLVHVQDAKHLPVALINSLPDTERFLTLMLKSPSYSFDKSDYLDAATSKFLTLIE